MTHIPDMRKPRDEDAEGEPFESLVNPQIRQFLA
jgi:hypothetical protein